MDFTQQKSALGCLESPEVGKPPIILSIHETASITSSDSSESGAKEFQYTKPVCSSISFQSPDDSLPRQPLEHDVYQSPTTTTWTKLAETVRLIYTRGKVSLQQHEHEQQPISAVGRFNHCYVYPLDNRSGKNERILLGRWAPKLEIQDGQGTRQIVIQAASHNYAGFYHLTKEAEELQHLALEKLPVADSSAVRSLESAMHDGIARFFSADFCCTTSTGYGSNLLAFSAILNEDWLVMLDDKCHNSMHVAAYFSHAGLVKKFPHADLERMEEMIAEYKGRFANVLVAIEGFYRSVIMSSHKSFAKRNSMDGAVPALDKLTRLKEKYDFTLLADEAHSLMCLGRSGRGCIEVWNEQHPDKLVPSDLFDMRTATLSKSVGAIGGIVCGKSRFASAVLRRREEMLVAGVDPIPTSSIIQTLNVLGQPTLLQRHLRRLAVMTTFVREELRRANIHVYGNAISPILPVYAGRPSMAAKMSYALRKVGLLATPVSTPAVPFWESRVRICLSADHDNDTVNGLIVAIVTAARSIGLIRNTKFEARLFNYLDEPPPEREGIEALQTANYIRRLVDQDVRSTDTIHSDAILGAGHTARSKYGLGSGGARWITGTSQLHIQVEKLVERLTRTPEALTYPDSFIGLMSTVAALCRPVLGFKKHVFLVPESAPQAAWAGFRVASKKGAPKVQQYGNSINSLLDHVRSCGRTTYVTLLVDSAFKGQRDGMVEQCNPIEMVQKMRGPSGMTVLLYDSVGVGILWSSARPRSASASAASAMMPKFRDHHFLIYGSFYTAFGLPGAYLAGSAVLLKELRYTSRGYMFTTSQQPFIVGMVAAELQRMMMEGGSDDTV
ncbi:hypothetical protein AYO20_07871 [Fonsecaea nubica]|uniref:Aminotransferase class I/classII large domain-containing protein n=1 Tax=Fonsecaea nubica TaxID=856822 RepID=A0A178CUI0_9EURO|nr:hypothetical protein AYO20_07871 [Fonsecaea nubica]OAL32561.1 hypothetical protein AYO20_07871 [Fonsecaea nubica]